MKKDVEIRLQAAEQVISRMERLHADDPEVDRALDEAWKVSVFAATQALRAWVDGKSRKIKATDDLV